VFSPFQKSLFLIRIPKTVFSWPTCILKHNSYLLSLWTTCVSYIYKYVHMHLHYVYICI
jgi:hypothetical protein